jgi:hypothetical protein
MRTRRGATLEDLRHAVESLPRHTRVAMLEGIEANPIIVGAYATGDGVCPMLAAHRAGGRTAAISFARAWDRVAFRDAGGTRDARARRATERELLILRSHLEVSLLDDELAVATPSGAREQHEPLPVRSARDAEVPAPARSAHDAAVPAPARSAHDAECPAPAPRTRPGDPDRDPELRDRAGWAWTPVVRRYDDYARALAGLDELRASVPASVPAGTR